MVSDQQNLVAQYDFESIMHYPLNEFMTNKVRFYYEHLVIAAPDQSNKFVSYVNLNRYPYQRV